VTDGDPDAAGHRPVTSGHRPVTSVHRLRNGADRPETDSVP
jgi:hypothetical protein